MKKLFLTISLIAIISMVSIAQSLKKSDTITFQSESKDMYRKHSIGSSLWMIGNLFPEPADFYQLSYGYQFSRKDNILVEAITWTYYEPLGTYGHSEENYPGKIRAYGVGIGYQRFHWKNLFTTVVATPFLQQFYDEDNVKIQKGLQLYLQLIVGYRFEFFNKRLYIEPAYALKYWPINTNFPKAFSDVEQGAPKYKFESSLNFGVRF